MDGELTLEMIVTAEVLAVVGSDPDLAAQLRDLTAASAATVFRYDGEIPHILAVADDLISLGVDDDRGRSQALLEATDPRLHDWATGTLDEYRAAATKVMAADISP
jgi:hypothetical protein